MSVLVRESAFVAAVLLPDGGLEPDMLVRSFAKRIEHKACRSFHYKTLEHELQCLAIT